MPALTMTRGATLSACGRYRYHLWREWAPGTPGMLILMLNPSKADAERDDHTITKVIAMAKHLGYGRIDVGNLAALRATDPEELRHAADPIGPGNDHHLQAMMGRAALTVCAWGANAALLPGRVQAVAALLRAAEVTPHALRLTQAGYPSHPLARGKGFIPLDVIPQPFALE